LTWVDVDVKVSHFDISDTSIGTDSLGPSVVFLLDFLQNDKPCCYLYHYSYLELDESKLKSVEEILVEYLKIIWESLKDVIENKLTSSDVLDNTNLSNFKLLVGGGDIILEKLTREAFNLLKNDEMNAMINLCDDEQILYFYKQLIKNNYFKTSLQNDEQ
jgi:hypothetical protein